MTFQRPILSLAATLAWAGAFAAPASAPTPAAFQQWRLPAKVPHPAGNEPSAARTELGQMLFFDKHLSGDGSLSCASCHVPELGWSDGKPVSIGIGGKPMARNSQSLVNVGYYPGPLMWAGQKKHLEDQVNGPMKSPDIMATDIDAVTAWLASVPAYKERFERAYPGEGINLGTLAKALANFERTIISRDTPFDQWLAGKANAMSAQQLRGLRLFTRADKGNCASCHTAPTFSDNGFYNLGLASTDIGRGKFSPLPLMNGAFRTPQLRDTEHKAPYMHDGSLKTLMAVVEHYNKGGGQAGTGSVSPGLRPLHLSQREKEDLVAFLKALSGPVQTMAPPALP